MIPKIHHGLTFIFTKNNFHVKSLHMNILNCAHSLLHPFETITNIVRSQLVITNSSLRQNLFDKNAMRLTEYTLHSRDCGITSEKHCKEDIIVSLTSYGKRIYDVYLTIESIMQGSLKPNRILLWLSKEEFSEVTLPITLQKQMERGLEVRFCKDVRSFNKLIFSLKEFPNSCIITIDDDLIYNFDLVENLVNAHKNNPNCIWANRINEMTFTDKGTLKSYLQWKGSIKEDSSNKKNNFFTGVGGVLYPPNSLHDEVFNDDVFTNICPTADDVWFNAMARLKGTEIRKSYTHSSKGEDFLVNESLQSEGLCAINNNPNDCQNDKQIKAVFEKYSIQKI